MFHLKAWSGNLGKKHEGTRQMHAKNLNSEAGHLKEVYDMGIFYLLVKIHLPFANPKFFVCL